MVFLTLLLGLSVSGFPATAAGAPSVPIKTVHFVGGQLVQSTAQANLWTEYDFNGTKRYTFNTKTYDKQTLRLKGQTLKNQTGQVELLIDLKARTVSGEWPGHPMAKLYNITNVDYFTAKPKETISRDDRGNAVENVTPPQYIPPAKKQPLPQPTLEPTPPQTSAPATPTEETPSPVTQTPVTPPSPVTPVTPIVESSAPEPLTPATLRSATYEGGRFVQKEDKNWEEQTKENIIYSYQPLGYDDRSVFLYDTERKTLIELNLDTSKSRISRAGGVLTAYAPLIELSNRPASSSESGTDTLAGGVEPPDPALPSKLSAVERAVCLSKNGVVERAGLLGSERCTLSYTDGGNICIDSSNCQGKCLTTVNKKGTGAISGQCQKTDNPFGCHSEVLGGKVQPGLCVD